MCKDLLGYDLDNPEEREQIEEKQICETRCPKFIKNAVGVLEKLL
jgi:hypothetical protein